MRKKDLAHISNQVMVLEQMHTVAVEGLTEIIAKSFSTLATLDPEIALDIMNQLVKQKPKIQKLSAERELDNIKNVQALVNSLPNRIVFDDDDVQEQ